VSLGSPPAGSYVGPGCLLLLTTSVSWAAGDYWNVGIDYGSVNVGLAYHDRSNGGYDQLVIGVRNTSALGGIHDFYPGQGASAPSGASVTMTALVLNGFTSKDSGTFSFLWEPAGYVPGLLEFLSSSAFTSSILTTILNNTQRSWP
jgi:hypothetical protein